MKTDKNEPILVKSKNYLITKKELKELLPISTYGVYKYRLGDLLMLDTSHTHYVKRDDVCQDENSIGCKYFDNRKVYQDWNTLSNLIDEYTDSHNIKSTNDTICVHIRLGDENRIRAYQISKLIKHIHDIQNKFNINKVVIVTQMHSRNEQKFIYYNETSYDYLYKIIKSINCDVYIKSGDTDHDICFLVNAKYVIVTNGSFSHIVYSCCDNTVIVVGDILMK
jgi:hypothetical protein